MSTPAILETALYCDDLDAAKRFYGGVLGLEMIVEVPGRHVFFRLAGSVLLLFDPDATSASYEGEGIDVPPHGARGPGHACLRADGDELQRWRARLVAAGVPIERDITWPNGANSFYFRDPAGNSLEFGEGALWDV